MKVAAVGIEGVRIVVVGTEVAVAVEFEVVKVVENAEVEVFAKSRVVVVGVN